jgi:aminomethyltransferase
MSRQILQAFGVSASTSWRLGWWKPPSSRWLRVDRAGYTGDLGYEVWVKPQDAIWLWDSLLRVGEPYKIAPMGSAALNIARIEAGFILVDVDYLAANYAVRPTQRSRLQDVGWTVSLKKIATSSASALNGRAQNLSPPADGIEIRGKPAPNSIYADKPGRRRSASCLGDLVADLVNIACRVPRPMPNRALMWIEIWYRRK